MVTGCGGETPARNALGTTAYPALPVSKRGREVTVEAQWRSCGGVRVARRERGQQWRRRRARAALRCGGERRKQELEWWRGEAHGVRCGFKTEDTGSGSGQPQRVAWAVSRPATRVPHAAGVF